MNRFFAACGFSLLAGIANAQHQPYAGQQARDLKALG